MKAQRAHGRAYLAWILLAGGCTVYESNLLGAPAGASGGSTAQAGDAGSAGHEPGTAGSAGTASSGSGGGSSGSEPTGGTSSGNGAGGESSASAGGEVAADGGAGTCLPETLEEFCARLGNDCGPVDGTDNCGSPLIAVDCGTCSGLARCGGAGEQNVCGALTDPALGGTATASSVMFTHENGSKAFDLDITSKWYAGDGNPTGWVAYQFPGNAAHAVTSYSVTSANDVPGRDPADWQLQGSDDGVQWATVDQRAAQVFSDRRQTKLYTCAHSPAYRWYRLLITANSGATSLQLAELVLYAN